MISELQTSIANRLKDLHRYEGPVGVDPITEQLGDLETEIRKRAEKTGLAIVVITPDINRGETVRQLNVTVLVGVIENRHQNQSSTGTRKAAIDVVTSVIACLDAYQPTDAAWSPLLFAGAELQPPSREVPEVVYEVSFTTNAHYQVS